MKVKLGLFDVNTITSLKRTLENQMCTSCMGTLSCISGHFIFYYSQNPIIQIQFLW